MTAMDAADKEVEKAYRDWAWLKDGVPLGYMPPNEAARIAFRAGAEWARRKSGDGEATDRDARESWYCEPCAVEVYERRCPHCGKLKHERA